jgi:hypothetical protein
VVSGGTSRAVVWHCKSEQPSKRDSTEVPTSGGVGLHHRRSPRRSRRAVVSHAVLLSGSTAVP